MYLLQRNSVRASSACSAAAYMRFCLREISCCCYCCCCCSILFFFFFFSSIPRLVHLRRVLLNELWVVCCARPLRCNAALPRLCMIMCLEFSKSIAMRVGNSRFAANQPFWATVKWAKKSAWQHLLVEQLQLHTYIHTYAFTIMATPIFVASPFMLAATATCPFTDRLRVKNTFATYFCCLQHRHRHI